MSRTMRNFSVFIVLILFLSIISCSVFKQTSNISDVKVIFPAPPDTTRIQFLTALSGAESIEGKQSAFSKFIAGEEKSKSIIKPFGVAMRFGKIYICDPGLKGLEIIDLENKKFDYFKPEGKGQLQLPIGCHVDEKGWLFVADADRRQVVIFDNTLKYVDCLGENEDFKPTDVFVTDNKIWVANVKNHGIFVYDLATYKFLFSFPNLEFGNEGYLNQPTSLTINNNRIFVSDFGDFRIKEYNLEGTYLKSIGSYGKNPGQFVRPKGIAVDRNENLYVVDAGFENTQIFNNESRLLMHFGGPYTGPGFMYLPAGIAISYENTQYFEKYLDPTYSLKYLILVTNQYGPDKLSIYGYVVPKE